LLELPNVPAIGGHGPRSALQHCELCALDLHGRAGKSPIIFFSAFFFLFFLFHMGGRSYSLHTMMSLYSQSASSFRVCYLPIFRSAAWLQASSCTPSETHTYTWTTGRRSNSSWPAFPGLSPPWPSSRKPTVRNKLTNCLKLVLGRRIAQICTSLSWLSFLLLSLGLALTGIFASLLIGFCFYHGTLFVINLVSFHSLFRRAHHRHWRLRFFGLCDRRLQPARNHQNGDGCVKPMQCTCLCIIFVNLHIIIKLWFPEKLC